MTTPLDIITEAIRATDVESPWWTAKVAVSALTDERIVDHLTEALYRRGWGSIGDGTLKDMVRDAMRELAGA